MVVLSALRRRSDLLPAGVGAPGERILRRRARRHGGISVRICPQQRDHMHRAHRPARRQGQDHRFRSALSPVRPRVSAAADFSHRRADCRPAAHHHSDAADLRLRQADSEPFARQQPHPLCRRRHRHPPDHRRAAVDDRQRGAVRGDPAAASGVRSRRAVHRRLAENLPRFPRTHARLLDGMGAPAVDLLRLAGGDHPRRHYAKALQFR